MEISRFTPSTLPKSELSRFLSDWDADRSHEEFFTWPGGKIREVLKIDPAWVAHSDNMFMGLVILKEIDDLWEVLFLAAHPRHRRQGIMKQIFSSIFKALPGDGRIWLEVHEKNLPAISLYEALGMQQVGRRPKYYRDGGAALLYSSQKTC